MSPVILEQLKIFVSQLFYGRGKLLIKSPIFPAGAVSHKSVQRPSRKSRNASSARESNRPAFTSASNCRSHAAASNSSNQARKTASCSRDSLLTAVSISGTELMLKYAHQ